MLRTYLLVHCSIQKLLVHVLHSATRWNLKPNGRLIETSKPSTRYERNRLSWIPSLSSLYRKYAVAGHDHIWYGRQISSFSQESQEEGLLRYFRVIYLSKIQGIRFLFFKRSWDFLRKRESLRRGCDRKSFLKLRLKERGNPQVSGFAHHEEILSTSSASKTACTGRWNVSCDFLSWRFSPHSSAIAVKEVSCVKISFLMSTTNSHLKSYSLFPGHSGNFSNNKGRSLLQAVLNILLPMSTNSRRFGAAK